MSRMRCPFNKVDCLWITPIAHYCRKRFWDGRMPTEPSCFSYSPANKGKGN